MEICIVFMQNFYLFLDRHRRPIGKTHIFNDDDDKQ